MEATVLRAALSAAIRVTVSTSLLGCGGVTTGGESSSGPNGSSPTAKNDPSQDVPTPAPTYGYGQSAGGSPTSAGGPSIASAGAEAIAMAAGAGGVISGQAGAAAAGGGGAAGASTSCDELETACKALEEHVGVDPWMLPDNAGTQACCQLISGVVAPGGDACALTLRPRFEDLHWPCCQVLDFPSGPACAPWGPPVPPELELEQLLAWEAAA